MIRRWLPVMLAVVAGVSLWSASGSSARASDPPLPRFYYYPYYYYPHNYWPTLSPQWPEPQGAMPSNL